MCQEYRDQTKIMCDSDGLGCQRLVFFMKRYQMSKFMVGIVTLLEFPVSLARNFVWMAVLVKKQ